MAGGWVVALVDGAGLRRGGRRWVEEYGSDEQEAEDEGGRREGGRCR